LQDAQSAASVANDQYYQAIRYKNLTPAQRTQLYNTIAQPKQQELSQTIQWELEKNMAAQGLKSGPVSDTAATADFTPQPNGKKASDEDRKKIKAALGYSDKPVKTQSPAYASKKKHDEPGDPTLTPDTTAISTDPVKVEEVVFKNPKSTTRQPASAATPSKDQ
jgi:hypothetical protein